MKWSPQQVAMFRAALDDEEAPTPEPLTTRPELLPGLDWVYDGFFQLGRSSGMGVGPISLREKREWLDEYGVRSPIVRWFVIHCWEKMDPVFLKMEHERSEKAAKKKGKSPSGGKPTMGSDS